MKRIARQCFAVLLFVCTLIIVFVWGLLFAVELFYQGLSSLYESVMFSFGPAPFFQDFDIQYLPMLLYFAIFNVALGHDLMPLYPQFIAIFVNYFFVTRSFRAMKRAFKKTEAAAKN